MVPRVLEYQGFFRVIIVREVYSQRTSESLVRANTVHCLEALAVDDSGSGLVVLLLGDPHLLEGGEGGQDRATDPDRVLALRGSDDLDLHGGRSKGDHLLGEALSDALVHGGSTRENDVGVQVLADVDIALHDGLEHGVVDSLGLLSDEGRLEEHLRATEALVSDGDDVSVRELVRLLESRGGGSGLHLLVEVEGDVAELLLDVTNDFTLSGGGEGVSTLSEDLHEVLSQVTSSQVDTEDSVGESVSLVDGDSVGDTISRVEHSSSGTTRGVQGEHGLDVDVHGRDVEGLEHDLGHALTVSLGVEGSLGEEDGVLLGGDTELVVEGVVPDLLHIIPVGDDTVLDGVLEGQDTTLGLGLVSDVGVLLVHADHDSGVLGASHDGGEDSARGVISRESGLAHTGSVVDHQGLNVVVGHFLQDIMLV